jgi:simple sugar transport system ATP-binding protein
MVVHGRPRPFLFDVNLQVRQGEILGIAGVAGNGLGELEDVLGGMKQQGTVSGESRLEERNILGLPPARLRSAGFAYVPADRLQRGSSLLLSVSDNLIVADHHRFLSHGVMQKNKISSFACELIDKFSIKGTMQMPIGTLSGGNIQKTVLSREFSRRPKFLLISEPTWGLDVACSEFVYKQILFMRAQGTAILLISSNLDEVLALSDTIAVLYQGQVVGKFVNKNLDREFLGGYMLGLKRDESAAEPSQIMAVT